MTTNQLTDLMFFLFDNEFYEETKFEFKKFSHFANDDCKIVNLMSEILTTSDNSEIIKKFKEFDNLSESNLFPCLEKTKYILAIKCYKENKLNYDLLLNNFEKNKIDLYYDLDYPLVITDGLKSLSFNIVNQNDKLINFLNANIKDKDIFSLNIEKLDDEIQKNKLKIIHSLYMGTYDYGYEAVLKLLNTLDISKVNIKNWKTEFSNYLCIIDFIKHFSLNGYKFLNSKLYLRIKDIFQNYPPELSLISLHFVERDPASALKLFNETEKRLKIQYPIEDLEPFKKQYIEFMKSFNKYFKNFQNFNLEP